MQLSQEIFIIPKIGEPLKLFSIIAVYGVYLVAPIQHYRRVLCS